MEPEVIWRVGDRVEIAPRLFLWKAGARYGEVVASDYPKGYVKVKMDATGTIYSFTDEELTRIG